MEAEKLISVWEQKFWSSVTLTSFKYSSENPCMIYTYIISFTLLEILLDTFLGTQKIKHLVLYIAIGKQSYIAF